MPAPHLLHRATLAALFYTLLLALTASCGDDDASTPSDTNAATTSTGARVGEPCASNDDCKDDLACLAGELRCVVLCTPNSDDCGPGIACQTAGDTGFCPLTPEGS